MRFVVNLTGDSEETLTTEMYAVYEQADALIDKLRDLTVNGRNYPNDQDDLKLDQDERREMVLKAEEIRRWAQGGLLRLHEQRKK
jgi:hypothetical protein